jgi:hypothetical protein
MIAQDSIGVWRSCSCEYFEQELVINNNHKLASEIWIVSGAFLNCCG